MARTQVCDCVKACICRKQNKPVSTIINRYQHGTLRFIDSERMKMKRRRITHDNRFKRD